MHRYKQSFIFALLLGFLLGSAGCGKDFDYRHRYVGNYSFTHTVNSGSSGSKIILFDGSIYLGDAGELVIWADQGTAINASVDTEGKLGAVPTGYTFTGSFSDKKHLHFDRVSTDTTQSMTIATDGVRSKKYY